MRGGREISSRQIRGMVQRFLCAGRRIRRSECGRKSRPAPFEMTGGCGRLSKCFTARAKAARVYPLLMFVRQEPALAMMLSLYVTLGIFLLLATRNPSANRSLIAFTAWSSFAHATLMAVQAFRNFIARGELLGVALFAVIGVTLIVLAPAKQSMQSASAVGT